MTTLTFDQFRKANVARASKWHPQGIESWSPCDWLAAVTGELVELASLIKMRNRERDHLAGNKFHPTDEMIAKEIADVFTYLDLMAASLGIDMADCIVSKFNEVSERLGFPDRIELPTVTTVAEKTKRLRLYSGLWRFGLPPTNREGQSLSQFIESVDEWIDKTTGGAPIKPSMVDMFFSDEEAKAITAPNAILGDLKFAPAESSSYHYERAPGVHPQAWEPVIAAPAPNPHVREQFHHDDNGSVCAQWNSARGDSYGFSITVSDVLTIYWVQRQSHRHAPPRPACPHATVSRGAVKVGDTVATRYNGRRQVVTITAEKRERVCQSGTVFQVTPKLRTWRDRSNPYDEWPHEWYDAGWFTEIPK